MSSGLSEDDLERQFDNGWDAGSVECKCPTIPADPHFRRAEPVKEVVMPERKAISWGNKAETSVNASVTTKVTTDGTTERKAITWGNKGTEVTVSWTEEKKEPSKDTEQEEVKRTNPKRKAVTWGKSQSKQQKKKPAAVTWKSNSVTSPVGRIQSGTKSKRSAKAQCEYCGFYHKNQCARLEEMNDYWRKLEKDDEPIDGFCTFCKRQHFKPCNSLEEHKEYEKVLWRAYKNVCNTCGGRTSNGDTSSPSCNC